MAFSLDVAVSRTCHGRLTIATIASAEDREERRASAVNGTALPIGLAHSDTASMIG
jgi:hypothetical protein